MRLLISILLLTALLPIISFGKRANPLIAMQGIWEIKSINTKGNAFSKLKSKTNQIEILPSQNSWRINIGCNQIKIHTNQRVARVKKEEQKRQEEEEKVIKNN